MRPDSAQKWPEGQARHSEAMERNILQRQRKLGVSGTRRLLGWRDHVLARDMLSGTAFAFLLF